MGVTRRYWGEVGLAVGLAGLAALFARPLLLVGAAGVGGSLVARQYAFVRAASSVADALSVTQVPDAQRVGVDGDVRVAVEARVSAASPLGIEVEAAPPVGVEAVGGSARAALSVGERTAAATLDVRCPLAGEFRFDPPTVTAADPSGRFRTTIPTGESPTVTVSVRPRGPSDRHVGAGGQTLATPYGDDDTGERGQGLELAEVRPYVPGDSVGSIDWNATARRGEPHIREFELETDRRTALLVDCRSSMGAGPAGETAFEYARQVALGIVEHARKRSGPVGLYAVGDEGLRVRRPPDATRAGYAAVERWLQDLEPGTDSAAGRVGAGLSPAAARRRASRLRGDDSAFGARLRPFFGAADPSVERMENDPLYRTARIHLSELQGPVTTVVVTDDARRVETREAVEAARRRGGRVLVFVSPAALFEDGATDPGEADERDADFERFRRELSSMDRVSAFEVGPGDRLETLLAASEKRRLGAETGE